MSGLLWAFGAWLVFIAVWVLSHRWAMARDYVRYWYQARWLPLWAEMLIPMAPFSTAWFLVLTVALALNLPEVPTLAIVSAAFDLLFLQIVVSRRVPQPFLPRWLKDEIVAGTTRPALPSRDDWFYIVVIGLIGPLGGTYLFIEAVLRQT